MINVSNEFWKLMQTRTDFKENAEITFTDGTVLKLSEADFTISNNSITDAAGSNSIPLGVALARSVQIELMNDDKRFSTYDFFGATVRLYLTFQLSETIEKIEYGFFTVVSPATYGTTVIITAIDDMHKTDKAYTTNLTFPQKAWVVLEDCCSTCDIALSTTEFLNKDFEIKEKPAGDYTHRQIIGFIAMIACGNARINRQGYLEILSYDFSFLNEDVDGGTYRPWTEGYVADGGTFNPWNVGDALDGGKYTDKKDYHILYNFKNLKVDTDDVVITGLQTSYSVETENEKVETKTTLLGQEGYVLKIENPLILGQEETALEMLGEVLLGGRMRKFEGDHIGYPIAEFMDNAFVVDREGNTYGTVLTDINFTFFGFTTFKNSAENALRNACRYQSSGVQAIIEARKLIEKEKSNREVALEKLSKQLATSSGLFATEETQEDGSKIYYMHDKKTLEESAIVWKMTAQAFGISLDGGKTYPYGLTATGTAILEMIYTIGLNANYVKTGRLSDSTGSNYIDLDTGEFKLSAAAVMGNTTVGDIERQIAENTENINETGQRLERETNDAFDSVNQDIEVLRKQVEMSMTSEEVKIEIQKEIEKGATKVVTSKGYVFGDEGFQVSSSTSELETTITEDGMSVERSGEKVLVANSAGVDAQNLHATTYLIVGAGSRFEDYVKDGELRTGCFFIGGEN